MSKDSDIDDLIAASEKERIALVKEAALARESARLKTALIPPAPPRKPQFGK
jgi:hypothetical protein